MKLRVPPRGERPRELRRGCILPARLRHGTSWSDTCILNISSRGLMIHTGRSIQQGTLVELRRGDCIVIARVMWRDGGRAGLRAEGRVPVDRIIALGQLAAFPASSGERRRHERNKEPSLLRERAIAFGGMLIITLCLAAAGLSMARPAFERPMAMLAAAFDP